MMIKQIMNYVHNSPASVWTLLYLQYTIIVLKPAQPPISMVFAINNQDSAFELFMRNWIQMKKQNNDINRLFNYWVTGKKPTSPSNKLSEIN